MSAESLRPADLQARALARTLFDVPLALEAGAGTGKTAALVARVATWVLTGGWERARAALGEAADAQAIAARALERVVLVTFTEKAAVEMEQRVAKALRALARGDDVPGLETAELGLDERARCARAAAAVAALDSLAVRTIHAFASALLSRHALAAGLHPAFELDADGSLVRAACAEAVADALPRALGERPDAHWLALLELGPGPQEVLEALRTLVGERVTPQELARDPYPAGRVAELARAAGMRAGALAERILEALPDKHNRNTAKAIEVATALADVALPLTAVTGPDALPEGLELSRSVRERLREYEAAKFTDSERKALGEAAPEVVRGAAGLADDLALLADIDAPLARAARGVLLPLLEQVRARLRARGVLTFEDLLVHARDLLRDDEAVRRAVRREIDQLLVDEFQDTDVVQCEIVSWIALDGPRAQRPGLFLVGDPKQSIYGWRSADLAAYEAMLQRLEAEGGRRARLSVNYRSSQAVLDEVERLVAPSMRPVPGLQPEFQPLLEGRRAVTPPAVLFAADRAAVEHWSTGAPPPADGRWLAEDARRAEARRIALELAELTAGGVALERCAILLRTSTKQEFLLEALREAGVPYAVGKDKGYFLSREVSDASALVACLLDPSDALSLLVFLRSPVCGVPDAALAPLWRLGLPERVARLDGRDPAALEELLALLPRAEQAAREALAAGPRSAAALARVAGWRLCAESGLRALAALRADLTELPADRLVERLRALLCPEVGEAARFPGAHRLANLEHFFASLIEALTQARGGAAGVLRELRAGQSGEREARSASPDDVGERAVRVLTVHSAKGLQFQSVWLADLQHGTRSGDRRTPPARVERDALSCEIELFGAASLERPRLDERSEAVRAAEAVRLLYVAATRAEDRLVLSGVPGDPGKSDTLADLVARRAQSAQAWAALAEAYRSHGRAHLAHEGARFVLASAPQEAAPTRAARAAAPTLAPLSAHAPDRARAARPLHAAISSSERARERAGREGEEGRGGPRRDVARAAGSAVHAALERWPVGRADAAAVARAALERELAARVHPATLPEARRAALALFETFASSDLARRLDALAGRFHARELPLLLRAKRADGPTGAWVGAADLVFEEDGALVVVDFKTDAGEDDALVATYRPQLELYAQALGAALARPVLRAQLWRIGQGRAVDVPLG